MIDVADPDLWNLHIAASYRVSVTVEAWLGGVYQRDIPISDGTVTLDIDNDQYCSLDITVADPDMLAEDDTALLLPFGQRLQVVYGVGTSQEMQALRLASEFLIIETPTAAGVLSERKVKASSTVEMIKDARFLIPYQAPAGGSLVDTLTTLVTDVVPHSTITNNGVADKTFSSSNPPSWDRERWDAVEDILDRLDAVLHPVPGGFHLDQQPEPEPDMYVSVWSIEAGKNLLEGTQPEVRRDSRYNAVVAFNPDDETVWGVAYVDDPTHPARWNGPYGQRPAFYASPLLTAATVDQAAQTRLKTINGRAREFTVTTVLNPRVEPGDYLDILWPTGATEQVMVRKVQIPLVPGSMTLTVQGVG